MYRKLAYVAAILCLITSAPSVWANNVFVLPNGTNSRVVNVFDGDTLAPTGTFFGPEGAGLDTIASPDSPVTYWTPGAATSDTLVGVNSDLSDVQRFSTSLPGTAGAVTPNGDFFILLAGGLRVYDTQSNTEVPAFSGLDVGLNPIDVAISSDSKYAYVLSSDSQRVTRVNLQTRAVEGTVAIAGFSFGISVNANGTVYVSGTNRITVLDGRTLETKTFIGLNGQPAKVYFTPDNTKGLAVNRNVITGTAVWIIDLETNTILDSIATLKSGITPIVLEDKILVASNERVFVTGDTNNILYELVLDPSINIFPYEVQGVGFPSGVISAALSNETPDAKYLYYATATTLTRVDLNTNGLSGTPAGIAGNVNRIAYARQPSTNAPAAVYKLNDPQQVPEDGSVPFKPLIIVVVDAAGRPVYDATVSWNTVVEGVTINGMLRTNLNGIAEATVDPGDVVGPIDINVLVGGLAGGFSLRVGAGGGGGSDQGDGTPTGGIFIVAGNGQLVRTQSTTAFSNSISPRVVVRDVDGARAAGAKVTWVLTGPGSLQNVHTLTDDNGEATADFLSGNIPPGFGFQQSKITAESGGLSVEFWITTYPEADIFNNLVPQPQVQLFGPQTITGKIGQPLPDAVRLRVTSAAGSNVGQPIPNVALEAFGGNRYLQKVDNGDGTTSDVWIQTESPVTAHCQGGVVLTDAHGDANCNLILGGKIGEGPLTLLVGGYFRIFSNRTVVATPGDPGLIELAVGDSQAGGPGDILPLPFIARITDVSGNPLEGVDVEWSVVTPNTLSLSNMTTTTDVNGRVTASGTLGVIPGDHFVRIKAGGIEALFKVTVVLDITSITPVSGGGQQADEGEQFAMPLVALLGAENGDPVVGQTVNFTVESGDAELGSNTGVTDVHGQVSLLVTAGQTPGEVVIAARFGGLSPARFTLTVVAPGPKVTAVNFTNGASEVPGVVPGSIIKITGEGIAGNVVGCQLPTNQFGPLPLELAGVSVQFGPDNAAIFSPIFYVCNQGGEESVAIQAPFELVPGLTQATIRSGGGMTRVNNVEVLAIQPGIFETPLPGGSRVGVVMRPDGSFVSPTNPAHQGEQLILFATGLGAVTPPSSTNATGLVGQLVTANIVVGVANQGVRVIRAEYAAGNRGLYAVYFEIPVDPSFVGQNLPLALAALDNGELTFGNGSSIAVAP